MFSEYFFEAPQRLRTEYPAVYHQLMQYYRQDPEARLEQQHNHSWSKGTDPFNSEK